MSINNQITSGRAQWSSTNSYLLVTIGAVVGMGNVFRFPFLVYEYGGLFILFYLACEIAIALPLFLAELSIGRRGKQNPVGAFEILCLESGRSTLWRWVGWLASAGAFLTLAYYIVSAAFPVGYFFKTATLASMENIKTVAPTLVGEHLTTNFFQLEICFLIFLAMVMLVIYRGINRGLESISRLIVPLYFGILLLLAIYTSIIGRFDDALRHLLYAPLNMPVTTIFFAALTFAFFKLGVGMGTMIVYGSYLPHSVPLGRSTLIILLADAIVSLLAYFVIFPLIFQTGAQVIGDQLTNYNIAFIFTNIPHGFFIAACFFFAATLAAWTPTIAMAETVAITLIERFNLRRSTVAWLISAAILVLGTVEVLFHTTMIDEKWLGTIELHQILENLTGDIIIPISALLTAIFVGWIINKSITAAELSFKPTIYNLWLLSVRFLAPLSIFIILAI